MSMSSPSLKGKLEEFRLADVLSLLGSLKKTGALRVWSPVGEGCIWLRDGQVWMAAAPGHVLPLGERLVAAGLVSRSALKGALAKQARTGRRVGEILVEEGQVSAEALGRVLLEQVLESVFALLPWEGGEFEFEPGKEPDWALDRGLGVEVLVFEGARRIEEWEVIKRRVPSMTAVLRPVPELPPGATEVRLTPEEWRVLSLVDGRRTLEEIARLAGIGEFQAARTAYALVTSGLVEVAEAGAEGGGEPAFLTSVRQALQRLGGGGSEVASEEGSRGGEEAAAVLAQEPSRFEAEPEPSPPEPPPARVAPQQPVAARATEELLVQPAGAPLEEELIAPVSSPREPAGAREEGRGAVEERDRPGGGEEGSTAQAEEAALGIKELAQDETVRASDSREEGEVGEEEVAEDELLPKGLLMRLFSAARRKQQ